MNTGGKGSVENRRAAIKEVVEHVTADVILLQEANSPRRNEVGYAQEFGNDEASVMAQRNAERNESVTAYKKTQDHMNKTYHKKKGKGGNHDIPSFQLSRVASCLFDDKIVCVSWHSRHTGIKDGSKTKSLIALLDYIQRIKGDLPFILGGDFNIEAWKVREVLKSTKLQEEGLAGLKLYNADDRYEEKVMVIASWELVAQRGLKVHGQKHLSKEKRILDHLQLELEFSISSNSHLETEYGCVSDMLQAALTHTVSPWFGGDYNKCINREGRSQAHHLSTVAPLFKTCVKECIRVCSDYKDSIQRAHEIVDITEHIVTLFLQDNPPHPFKNVRDLIDETEEEREIVRVQTNLVNKLTEMFKNLKFIDLASE